MGEGLLRASSHWRYAVAVTLPIIAESNEIKQNKLSKLIPYFRIKRLKTHTLWRRTYLYSLYKGVSPPPPHPRPPGGEKRVADYESHCLRKRD